MKQILWVNDAYFLVLLAAPQSPPNEKLQRVKWCGTINSQRKGADTERALFSRCQPVRARESQPLFSLDSGKNDG